MPGRSPRCAGSSRQLDPLVSPRHPYIGVDLYFDGVQNIAPAFSRTGPGVEKAAPLLVVASLVHVTCEPGASQTLDIPAASAGTTSADPLKQCAAPRACVAPSPARTKASLFPGGEPGAEALRRPMRHLAPRRDVKFRRLGAEHLALGRGREPAC